MLRVYVVDATTEVFQQVLPALGELLGEAMPSITTIGIDELPGLRRRLLWSEIMMENGC